MSFPMYSAYKDSGIEWLGNVPEHWAVMSLVRDVEFITSGARGWAENYSDDGDLFIRIGNLTRDSIKLDLSDVQRVVVPASAELDRTQVQAGDVLFSITAYLGSVAVVPPDLGKAFVSQHVALVRPKQRHCIPAWIGYVAISHVGKTHLETTGYGGTKVQLSLADVTTMPVLAPPKDEQAQLVSFLDRETAKIDALVAEQEQLITLLKEKRQAVISHAVTKGLNPTVPMKDSGVEWLGAVPAHWGIGKVKKFFATSSGSTPNTDKQDAYYNGDIPWIRSLDLTDGDIVEWEVGITPAAIDDTACKLLPVGTVLVAMYGGDGTIGKNGLLRILAATNQAICALLPSPQFEPEFVLAFMQHQRPYWMVGAEGTRKDPNISQDRVRNALMPCPPLPEQRVIVEHVKQALSAFGSLEKEAEAVIGILNERRSALISAAVTGQIDVRGLAPAQEQAA